MFAARKYAFLLAAFVASSATASAAPILDNFSGASTPVTVLQTGPGTAMSTAPTTIGVLPPFSRSSLVVLAAGNPAGASGLITLPGDGTATFTSSVDNTGSILSVIYNAGVGQNLSGSASLNLNVIMFETGGNPAAPTVSLFVNGTQTDSENVGLGLVSLSLGGGPLNSVTQLRLDFSLQQGDSFKLNNAPGFELIDPPGVPEPMTLATFGFLALCGGVAARRKLKAAGVAQA